MKFRFYIVSVFNGNIVGTNDEKVAALASGASDDFVIDVANNGWMQENDKGSPILVDIPEYKPKKKK